MSRGIIRRYIFRLILCVPATWFFLAIIFLHYNSQIKSSLETEPSEITTTIKHVPIKVVKKLIQDESLNEEKIDFNRPGEMGKGVEFNRTDLLPGELQKYEAEFQKHAFNVFASDLISVRRSLPDVRDLGCRRIEYNAQLVTAGVVMCFHNEAWSVLLRSIHSLIDRSSSNLLKEIILVDDFSDMGKLNFFFVDLLDKNLFSEHLKQPLDDYIKDLKIVSIIRQKQREGLIRSRLVGAAAVQSDVIIFLDSHIEVTEGWLEPLLGPISQNHTVVMTPVIDVIDDSTLKYIFDPSTSSVNVGGFDWNLLFTWHSLPEREKRRRKHYLDPVKTPTMSGGLFAISKRYFDDLGTCKMIGRKIIHFILFHSKMMLE